MIELLSNREIDKAKWYGCLSGSSRDSIFAQSWYLDLAFPGWMALVENDYEFVFPVTKGTRFSLSYFKQPFFIPYFSIYGNIEPGKEREEAFLDILRHKFLVIDIYLDQIQASESQKIKIEKRVIQVLELNVSYDKVCSGYSVNLKRLLKKARTLDLLVDKTRDSDMAVQFIKENVGHKLKLFKNKDYQVLHDLINACMSRGLAEIITVNHQGELLSLGVFFIFKNRAVYVKGASTIKGRKFSAMHFLLDRYICELAGSKKILDFGGSMVSSVAEFNMKFGASNYEYTRLMTSKFPMGLMRDK